VAPPVLSGCTNARDLGGLPTRDGRRIRWRTLIRTDSLAHLDAAGRAALERLEPGLILGAPAASFGRAASTTRRWTSWWSGW